MWTAEAYGSDAFTPIAWWGASTSTIRLATGIAQLSARTPAATAMQAMTLDHLSGGRVIDGPVALREALRARDDQFVQALTEKLMMYATGRELEYYDMPQVRAVVRAAKAQDYRFSALVAGVVQSDAFRLQATGRGDRSIF